MRFSVFWTLTAEMQLAERWTNSSDRAAISRAAAEIDSLLEKMADEVGESRDGGRRILHVPPLGVVYSVNSDAHTVLVLNVWQYSAKPNR